MAFIAFRGKRKLDNRGKGKGIYNGKAAYTRWYGNVHYCIYFPFDYPWGVPEESN